MSIEVASRKALAVFLIIVAALFGAAVLDIIQFNAITANTDAKMDHRFKERSTRIGAWIMDREHVTNYIGLPLEKLPSYQWAKQHHQEAP